MACGRQRLAGIDDAASALSDAGNVRGASGSSSDERAPAPIRGSQPETPLPVGSGYAERLVPHLRAPCRVLERTREASRFAIERSALVAVQRCNRDARGDREDRETTRISISVKPADSGFHSWPNGSQIPRADVGVVPGAARLSVGAEAQDVDFALEAGIQILVRSAPGILAAACRGSRSASSSAAAAAARGA